MNGQYLLDMIRSSLDNGELTYDEFDELFQWLPKREQYEVINFLQDELHVRIVDKKTFATSQEILELIEPHILNNELTYDDFDIIFANFDRRAQYAATNSLAKLGISLVDKGTLHPKIAPTEIPRQSLTVRRRPKEILCSNEELACLAQVGDEQARQDIFVRNQALIYHYAQKYDRTFNHSLTLEDLVQLGVIGMNTAIDRFDRRRGNKFTTYATWWISQSISRGLIDTGFAIRIPVHMFEAIFKMIRVSHVLLNKFGREATIYEIAVEMNSTIEQIRGLCDLKNNFLSMASLDIPINEDGDTTIGELIPDKFQEAVEEIIIRQDLRLQLERAMDTLKPREREILTLRYGFDGGTSWTLEGIGRIFGLTRERIRQIEYKALHKLRHPALSRNLKEFL